MAKDIHVPARIIGGKIPVKASLGQTVIVTEGPEEYTGPVTVTPSESEQVLQTADKLVMSNVTVGAIPDEYIVPTGTEEISVTENGTVTADVTAKASVTVNVDVPIPPGYIIPTGNMNITENGQYDVTEKASVTVDVPSGVETVTGEVTIADYGIFPTITHNFGTKKIGLIIYPISEVVGNAGYLRFYLSYINVKDIVGGVNWPLNFTSYNSKFSGTVNANANNLRTIATQLSPWTTQNTWYVAQQPDSQYNSGIVLTDDTIKSISYKWCNGTYRYIVYKLG